MTGSPPVHILRLPLPQPYDAVTLAAFLRAWAVPGVELVDTVAGRPRYARAVRLPHGPGAIRLTWGRDELTIEVVADPVDHAVVQAKAAALTDLRADSVAIDAHLARDPALRELVRAAPGLRIPGTTDRAELAVQVMISQQVSMAAAARCAAKLTQRHGDRLAQPVFGVEWLFPTPAALARADPEDLGMPKARGRALVGLAAALAAGDLDLDSGRPLGELRADLLARPGIGPWTHDCIAMRALGDTDVLLSTDLVIRRELADRGIIDAQAWSPYRSYATIHLWRRYVR